MKPEQFCYWLQGFFEISETEDLSTKQVSMINEHLQLVFTKVTGGSSGGSGGGGQQITPGRSIYNTPTGKGVMSCSVEPVVEGPFNLTCGMPPEQEVPELDEMGLKRYLDFVQESYVNKITPSPFHSSCHTRYC